MNRMLAVGFAAMFAVAGCAGDGDDTTAISPDSQCGDRNDGSVQRAVDRAAPGDVIIVPAGTYHEAIVVNTDGVTIRGADRNETILDGCDRALGVGVLVYGDEVTVENLTVRDYATTGIMFNGFESDGDDTPIDGFAIRYVTSTNNGLYGLYAFQSSNGIIADSYVSGHADSGVYVGQCDPCNTIVTGIVAEHNAVGYEGTNASRVWVVESEWVNNRIGITPNSQSLERLAPTTGTVIAGNIVADNNAVAAPEQASGGFGLGIAVGGGNTVTVANNLVVGHEQVGIAVTSLDGHDPVNNRVEGNIATGNTVDVAYWTDTDTGDAGGNRFEGNTFEVSSPANIEQFDVEQLGGAPVVRLIPGPEASPAPDAPTDLASLPADAAPIELPYAGPFPDPASISVPTR